MHRNNPVFSIQHDSTRGVITGLLAFLCTGDGCKRTKFLPRERLGSVLKHVYNAASAQQWCNETSIVTTPRLYDR